MNGWRRIQRGKIEGGDRKEDCFVREKKFGRGKREGRNLRIWLRRGNKSYLRANKK